MKRVYSKVREYEHFVMWEVKARNGTYRECFPHGVDPNTIIDPYEGRRNEHSVGNKGWTDDLFEKFKIKGL